MAIVSMPNSRNYDANYDQVFKKTGEQEQECGCKDCVCEASIRVKQDMGDPPYLATCDQFPDMQIRADSPAEAFEKAEAWLAQLRSEVQ